MHIGIVQEILLATSWSIMHVCVEVAMCIYCWHQDYIVLLIVEIVYIAYALPPLVNMLAVALCTRRVYPLHVAHVMNVCRVSPAKKMKFALLLEECIVCS